MLVTAYAATIHKSQGSEYPAVIIPVLTQHYPMLQRNLLYTASLVANGWSYSLDRRRPLPLRSPSGGGGGSAPRYLRHQPSYSRLLHQVSTGSRRKD